MKKLTDTQLEALMDLRHGEWTYGIKVRGRRALPSLMKLGLVHQSYGEREFGYTSADKWKIADAGQEAMQQQATLRHYRSLPDGARAELVD